MMLSLILIFKYISKSFGSHFILKISLNKSSNLFSSNLYINNPIDVNKTILESIISLSKIMKKKF